MNRITDIDESRRRFLLYLLSTGAFAALPGCANLPAVHQAMDVPEEMPEGMSIFQYMGAITVNGKPADLDTRINPGDTVETGEGGQLIFVVHKDAFLMRSNSTMRIPTKAVGGTYDIDRGKALSVFASRQTQIRTPTAIIAIRGTGVYVESEPDRSYVCTCYGVANLAPADDPSTNLTVTSKHHDDPRYILADKNAANRIQPAPFKNHDDQELLLIETLVGRSTPYVVPAGIPRTRGGYI
ncbi:MAG: hypothetical protein KDI19_07495 [Pseudomonadales bacterium]|nr:hypothetical protein [Pseudomonadales bacterium]